jgi:hypothetical protein
MACEFSPARMAGSSQMARVERTVLRIIGSVAGHLYGDPV